MIRAMMWSAWFAVILLCASQASNAKPACAINIIAEIPVRIAGNRPLIDGKIAGQAVRILIDTGSSTSFISEAEAKRLNLHLVGVDGLVVNGVGGQTRVFSTYVKGLQFGNVPPSNLRMLVIGPQKQKRNHVPDYVLGEDFFANFVTEFDFAHGVVRLLRKQDCKPEQLVYWSKEFSMGALDRASEDAPSINTTVELDGRSISAELDSGSRTSILTRSAAETAGMHFDEETHSVVIGLSGQPLASWVRTFPSLAIGDNETVKNVKLRVADLFGTNAAIGTESRPRDLGDVSPALLLGCDFFLAHRIIVLFDERKLMFTYNGGQIFQVVETDAEKSADTTETPVQPAQITR